MAAIAHKFAVRALSWTHDYEWQIVTAKDGLPSEPANSPMEQIQPASMAVLLVTGLIFVLATSLIAYVFGHVIPTLAMVETAPAHGLDEKSKEHEFLLGEELAVTKEPPMTASMFRAARKLRLQGGIFPRRGIWLLYLYTMLSNYMNTLGAGGLRSGVVKGTYVVVLVALLLSPLHLMWTQTVLTPRSHQPKWSTLLSTKNLRAILLPTAVWAVANQISILGPYALLITVAQPALEASATLIDKRIALVEAFGVLLIFLGTRLVIVIPAQVTLIRTEASLLAPDQETIVPFDRSFDGLLEPGTSAVTMLSAWKSFDRSARLRLLRLYFSYCCVQSAMAIFFATLITLELKVALGHEFCNMLRQASKSIQGEL